MFGNLWKALKFLFGYVDTAFFEFVGYILYLGTY